MIFIRPAEERSRRAMRGERGDMLTTRATGRHVETRGTTHTHSEV